jgi:energy-coupling factor transport system permease protein
MKDRISSFHPLVEFAYFALTLTFAMWFTHPVCQSVSLAAAFAYSVYLRGGRAARGGLLGLLPLIIITALLNPLFSHQGQTILAYLPSGNPLTEESVLYGLSAGAMLAAVICWFACLNAVFSGDKLVYLFGRAAPSASLLLAMTLRFVPLFTRRMRQTSLARRAAGSPQGVRESLKVLSGVTGWAMENAVDTADSMKSRGYGLPGRTAYSVCRFSRRDGRALLALGLCGAAVIFFKCSGALYWHYYPSVGGAAGPETYAAAAVYAALCFAPTVIGILEDAQWRALRSGT